MKSLVSKFTFALFLCFSSLVSLAQVHNAGFEINTKRSSDFRSATAHSFTASIEMQTDSSFRIIIDNPNKKILSLRITHQLSGVVKDTTIDSKKYVCLYNLGNADDGLYRVIVRNGKEKFRKNIQLNTITTLSRSLQIE